MLERAREHLCRLGGALRRQCGEPRAVARVHRELDRVELRRAAVELPLKFRARLQDVADRQTHETEQPVQPLGRIPLPAIRLPVLHGRPFAQRRFRLFERVPRDIDHRGFEMRERKVRIQLHRAAQRGEPLVSPRRVGEAEMMSPVLRFEPHGPACFIDRFTGAPGAHEQERERRVGFRKIAVQLDRAAHMPDRRREQRAVRLVARSRPLVLPEARVGEADVRERVPRVQLDRRFEVGDRVGHRRRVERLEAHAALREPPIGLETRRLVRRRSAPPDPGVRADRRRHLLDDPVLQLEHGGDVAVRLRVGDDLAGDDVDGARHDAKPIAGPLKAADDRQLDAEILAEARQRAAGAPHGFDDAYAIDDAQAAERAQIVGHRFGDARREPIDLGIRVDVREVEDRARADAGLGRRRGAARRSRVGGNRRDEAIPAPRDGLDVGGLRRIVAQRLPQLRDRLRQRVVGHDDVGPDGAEQVFFRDERRRAIEQVPQQIEHFRRERDRLAVFRQPERAAVERKRSEAIGSRFGRLHRVGPQINTSHRCRRSDQPQMHTDEHR